ncbi:MAG: Sigma-70 region 2 [Frankiaceae bacterium]|jgi:RNA polymerase sigma factor (sigma-70 family)|nr:Sigma-70 region 2 [Frankiaceae bacterium]
MDMETLQDDVQGERTPLSRPVPSVITTASRDRFDAAAHAVWPLLVARLRRAGASPEDAEDVAQEAMLRAWDRNIRFADDGDLLRWCTVVARRSHIDRVRRQARLLDLGELASDSACRELEAVELRHVLGTVSTAMASLTEQERASLQERPAEAPVDRASQVRSAVARHRARYRLRLLVGPFAAFGAQCVRVLRRGAPAAVVTCALAVAAVLSVTLGDPGRGVQAAPPGHLSGAGPARATGPLNGGRPGHRTVSPRMRRVSLARPAGQGPAAPSTVAAVSPAPGTGASVGTRPSTPDDSLVCLNDPTLGNVCVPQVPPPGPGPAAGPAGVGGR